MGNAWLLPGWLSVSSVLFCGKEAVLRLSGSFWSRQPRLSINKKPPFKVLLLTNPRLGPLWASVAQKQNKTGGVRFALPCFVSILGCDYINICLENIAYSKATLAHLAMWEPTKKRLKQLISDSGLHWFNSGGPGDCSWGGLGEMWESAFLTRGDGRWHHFYGYRISLLWWLWELGGNISKHSSWLPAPDYLSQRAATASLILSQGPKIFL